MISGPVMGAIRGATGFGLAGLILVSPLFFNPFGMGDNASRSLVPTEDSPAISGNWRGREGAVYSATFFPDGRFVLYPKRGRRTSEGTYRELDDATYELSSSAGWVEGVLGDFDLTLTREDESRQVFNRARDAGPKPLLPPIFSGAVWLLAPLFAGAVGAFVLTVGTSRAVAAMAGFGFGFIPAAFGMMFTFISIQGGGEPSYVWGATGCGISLGLAGAIGGRSTGRGLLLPGMIAFGIGGAVWGYWAFWYTGHEGPIAVRLVAHFLPFVGAGAFFGGFAGARGLDD